MPEAQEIRDSTDRHHVIAARYGVAQSTVTRIKNGTRRQTGGDIAAMA